MKTLPEKLKLDFDTTSQVSNITDTINEIISYLEEKEELPANGICPTCKADLPEEKKPNIELTWEQYQALLDISPLDILREKVNQLRDNKKETIAPLDEYQIVKYLTLDKILSIIDELKTK